MQLIVSQLIQAHGAAVTREKLLAFVEANPAQRVELLSARDAIPVPDPDPPLEPLQSPIGAPMPATASNQRATILQPALPLSQQPGAGSVLDELHAALPKTRRQGVHEGVATYLTRLAAGIEDADDLTFEQLPAAGLDWYANAKTAIVSGDDIPLPPGYVVPPSRRLNGIVNPGSPPPAAASPSIASEPEAEAKPRPAPPRGPAKAPDPDSPPRIKGGWGKGVSGNPAGLPPGTKHKRTIFFDALEAAAGPDAIVELVKTVFAAAKQGDMTAARILLDRLVPVRKGASCTGAAHPRRQPVCRRCTPSGGSAY